MEQSTQKKAEAPIQDYLVNFQMYDNKDRRLSIFGRVMELPGHSGDEGDEEPKQLLQITVLTLSTTPEIKKTFRKGGVGIRKVEVIYDVFSRKEGRQKYEEKCIKGNGQCPGKVFVVDIVDERPRFTFLQWCNQHYFRPQKISKTVEITKFVRGTDYVFPERKKKETSAS